MTTSIDRRILFFGDSFTAGVGDPTARGWVGRVAAASADAGAPITAYALGVRRETSVDVARRWRAEAQPRVAADAECRVVFAVGSNDASLEDGAARVPAERSTAALAGLLDGARDLGLPAFVVGPAPIAEYGAAGAERARARSELLAGVALARGIPFVPVAGALAGPSAWSAEALAGDGAHPGARGYAALAELVLASGWLEWLGVR